MQIILTHEHADAVLGLDDLWVALPSSQRNEKSSYFSHPVHNGQVILPFRANSVPTLNLLPAQHIYIV